MSLIKKRIQLRKNRLNGRYGENLFKLESAIGGFEVKRTSKGSDYKRRKVNLVTNKKSKWELVEVKTGKSKLSPLQKKTQKKIKNYKVKRYKKLY